MTSPESSALGTNPRAADVDDELAVVGAVRLETRITSGVGPSPQQISAQRSKPVMSGSWMSRRTMPGIELADRVDRGGSVGCLAHDVEPRRLEHRPRGRPEARMVVDDQHGAAHVREIVADGGRVAVRLAVLPGRTYVLSILQFSQRGCNARDEWC